MVVYCPEDYAFPDSPEAGRLDAEITPAMIQAGELAIAGFSEEFVGAEWWVRRIYVAMRLAATPCAAAALPQQQEAATAAARESDG